MYHSGILCSHCVKNCDLLFLMQGNTPMYLCGFLRLDLGLCSQDLKELGDKELEALQKMAAVFAGEAGEGAPSGVDVLKRVG